MRIPDRLSNYLKGSLSKKGVHLRHKYDVTNIIQPGTYSLCFCIFVLPLGKIAKYKSEIIVSDSQEILIIKYFIDTYYDVKSQDKTPLKMYEEKVESVEVTQHKISQVSALH